MEVADIDVPTEEKKEKTPIEEQEEVEDETREHSGSISKDKEQKVTFKPSKETTDISRLSAERGMVNPGADLSDVL